METMKNTEDAFVNASKYTGHAPTEPRSMGTYRIEMTHQAHVMAVLCTKEDHIIGVCRNLLEYNYGGLYILHKSRVEVALFMEALGISADTFGKSKQAFERFRLGIKFQPQPTRFGAFYK
jgi:hypothetical protein